MEIVSLDFNKKALKERFNIDGDITCIDNIKDISKYKADILIINLDCLKELYDNLYELDFISYKKYDLYEYDRLNRYKYSNYKKVIIISLDNLFYKYNFKSLYSNIVFVDDTNNIDLSIDDSSNKISNIKNNNINKLKEYVDKQTDYFDSIEIMKTFNVSNRWIKRYMKDMNDIYNNIGYSYSKRKWYKVYKG